MTAEDYFAAEAEALFSGPLHDLGARITDRTPLLVRFSAPGWFVEIFALAEDGPLYSPRVTMGPLPELGPLARDSQVDILHALPEESPLRRYNLEWRYDGPAEMRDAFARVRDEIFMPHAVPILLDPAALRGLVTQRSQEIAEDWHREIADHNDGIHRANARTALAAKDEAAFLAHMREIAVERRTPSEQARMDYLVRRNAS